MIVNEDGQRKFEEIHSNILTEYFTSRNIAIPKNFKLHYHVLRRRKPPYDKLSSVDCLAITDTVFSAICNIDCTLISVSINKRRHHEKYKNPVNVMVYVLLANMERFQFFLEDSNATGTAYYEEFTNRTRRKITHEIGAIHSMTNFSDTLNNIRGKIKNGHPTSDVVLQFADFFVYAVNIKLATNHEKQDRWKQLEHKYYKGKRWKRRGYAIL